ncbi:(Na+)-NQR maturation NqrM [Reinekea thalattae]|uniref:(Na+)-NQR maturation NqrM n=1 Tax=Reinekea thalattae TaxID=2593301 RepID=A0A5C8Z9P4_9GAMM|nr:(Na+)-NQR maturation NqrM [Reinekea thalattae]TXR53586.1 (Na+)-NQR maturation NqrM [Reinekea thalattae]
MLVTFLIVFLAFALIIAMMAVGVMFGQKPIAGSCGGMAAVGMEAECDVCGGDKSKCEKESKAVNSTVEAYDAGK